MITYITRRVLGLIPLLFGISVVSYALIGLAPGGAAAVFAGLQRQMTEADRQVILHNLGLDKPWYVQYFYWLKNLLINHSLGNSYIDGRPVLVKILEKVPVTLEVIGLSFVCTLLIAIPIAVYAATHKNSIFDHLATCSHSSATARRRSGSRSCCSSSSRCSCAGCRRAASPTCSRLTSISGSASNT